jgi:CubicO group peptidase (beta-lactamase class C family)
MQMVDLGKIKLDDPVAKYLPIFDKYMKRYLTIRHCLSHTTGLEREGGLFGKLSERSKYESLEEEVNAIAAKEISNNPGEVFFYGGYGLNIAARVCEVVSKKPFERLIQEKLTRPLKMKTTTFVNDMGGACNPSGGAKASANDYMNFMTMLLNNGLFEGKQILSTASIKEMHKIQFGALPIKYAPPAANGAKYGLGNWIISHDNDNNGLQVACPGLFGTWPYIDFKKKYAAILFVTNLKVVQRKESAQQFMDTLDGIL